MGSGKMKTKDRGGGLGAARERWRSLGGAKEKEGRATPQRGGKNPQGGDAWVVDSEARLDEYRYCGLTQGL